MRKKVFSLLSLLVAFFGFSQTTVYFKYDEAGNQRYRGPDINGKQASQSASDSATSKITSNQNQLIDEKTFWKYIKLYPVPVNDILTIDWNDEIDKLIESVSLYQHSTVHWKFQQQNLPSLNKQLQINMTSYEWGVYVLRFTLKDGRVFSKNITKK